MRLLFLIFAATTLLRPVEGKEPAVYAVIFTAPNCPDCKKAKREVLPSIKQEYKRKLRIRWVNIDTEKGDILYASAIEWLGIPASKQFIPMLVIGDKYVTGSKNIEKKLPEWTDKGLEEGGIPPPDIPGLKRSTSRDVLIRYRQKVAALHQ